MPLPADAVPQVYILTADRGAALPFYRDVLGLGAAQEDRWGAQFALGAGASLRLTDHPGWQPSPHPVLGWFVPDLAACLAGLRDSGVEALVYPGMGQDEQGIWTGPGARLAWIKDPDGNVLQLGEATG